MKPTTRALTIALAMLAGGCAGDDMQLGAAGTAPVAAADIRDAAGAVKAHSEVKLAPGGLRIGVKADAMAAGTYGIHIHAVGRCDAPGFTSAGPHWNPTARQHGKDNPQGMHHGDLPNIVIGADGRGSLDFVIAGATPADLLDADGAAVVIHAGPDDYRTDPSGNSGARVACGVLAAP
ncbi:MAG TPA: superoxide dismutase family protein [Allosphingosinicella sp.]|nr:superoxide dismutase family protein [Allosphingosinicella sp.]